MPKRLVREAVADALEKEDIEYAFGLPGGQSCFVLWDALYDTDVKTVLCRDERGGAFMAEGYSQVERGPAIAQGTIGPGWGNLLPAMMDSWRASIPLICIAPGVPTLTSGQKAMQEVPQFSVSKPITKWSWRLENPGKATWMMRRAFAEAQSGRPGPVLLDIPTEYGGVEADIPEYEPKPRATSYEPSLERTKEAADLLLEAEKPVIVAGNGILWSEAWEELRKFAELVGIPVLTTPGGKSAIPENHPLAAGVIGHGGSEFSNNQIEDVDLAFWIGSAIEDLATNVYTYGLPDGAKFIYADIDPGRMADSPWKPDVDLVGDAKITLSKLTDVCKKRVEKRDLDEIPRIKELQEAKKEAEEKIKDEQTADTTPIHPAQATKAINEKMPDDAVVVHDAGHQMCYVQGYPYFKIKEPGNWVTMSEYYHIGSGMAMAIGAQLATDNQVIYFGGDGGFNYFLPEIATAVEYETPVVWFIQDDRSIGWIRQWQREVHDERFMDTKFEPSVDFVKVAESMGAKGVKIESPEEIDEGYDQAFKLAEEGYPVVVDIISDWKPKFYGMMETIKAYTEDRIPMPGSK